MLVIHPCEQAEVLKSLVILSEPLNSLFAVQRAMRACKEFEVRCAYCTRHTRKQRSQFDELTSSSFLCLFCQVTFLAFSGTQVLLLNSLSVRAEIVAGTGSRLHSA
jgi:hypothetical protein